MPTESQFLSFFIHWCLVANFFFVLVGCFVLAFFVYVLFSLSLSPHSGRAFSDSNGTCLLVLNVIIVVLAAE